MINKDAHLISYCLTDDLQLWLEKNQDKFIIDIKFSHEVNSVEKCGEIDEIYSTEKFLIIFQTRNQKSLEQLKERFK